MDVLTLARNLPVHVPFRDIRDFPNLDTRIGWANVFFINLFGVNDGFIEFCPDNPPSDDEFLAFLWVVRPDLTAEIAKATTNKDFASKIVRQDWNNPD